MELHVARETKRRGHFSSQESSRHNTMPGLSHQPHVILKQTHADIYLNRQLVDSEYLVTKYLSPLQIKTLEASSSRGLHIQLAKDLPTIFERQSSLLDRRCLPYTLPESWPRNNTTLNDGCNLRWKLSNTACI